MKGVCNWSSMGLATPWHGFSCPRESASFYQLYEWILHTTWKNKEIEAFYTGVNYFVQSAILGTSWILWTPHRNQSRLRGQVICQSITFSVYSSKTKYNYILWLVSLYDWNLCDFYFSTYTRSAVDVLSRI
jgi:hypothetical protein